MQIIKQSFKIEYNYSIFFTHNLFNNTNKLLSDFFSAYTEQGFQRKVLVVVDGGFLSFYPGLVDDIKNYFATQVKHIQLAKDVIVVPGGEASKNDPDLFEKLAQAVDIYG
ncbi:MAG: 3-dehydroquinate synthase, partial [Dyadobacter sp.]